MNQGFKSGDRPKKINMIIVEKSSSPTMFHKCTFKQKHNEKKIEHNQFKGQNLGMRAQSGS